MTSPESGCISGVAYPAVKDVLFKEELYVTSGIAVAFEVAPVMVLFPLKGTFCLVVAFVH